MDATRRYLAHAHSHASRALHSHGHAHQHVARDSFTDDSTTDMPADTDDGSDKMINTLLIILGVVFFTLIALSVAFLFRRHRRQRAQREQQQHLDYKEAGLPGYDDAKRNHHGLTIETTHNGRQSVVFIGRNGQPMLANPNSPPHSPDNVPQIHITFPDETDEKGEQRNGQVLVVRVGDNATIGLEPVQDEQLPAYEKEAKSQFYSIDMDQIGGLKEKDPALFK